MSGPRAQTIRVGIIGVGFGQRVLVPAFRLDGRCEVAALCASHRERALAAARALDIPRASERWQDLVADPVLDAIAIAIPPVFQPHVALAALKHRKHLFCEKPLAATGEAAAALLAAARQRNVAHMVDFEFVVVEEWERAKSLVTSGALGRLRHAVVSWQVEARARQAGDDSWKGRADEGGGTLNLFGSHVFAYIEWLLGPIARVAARLWNCAESRSVDRHDTLAMLQLELADELPVSVTISTQAIAGSGHRVEIYGDEGSLLLENTTADYVRGFQLKCAGRDVGQPNLTVAPHQQSSAQDGRIAAVGRLASRFLDWIHDGTPRRPSFEEGHRVQCLLEAARRAHAAGTWVPAPPAPQDILAREVA